MTTDVTSEQFEKKECVPYDELIEVIREGRSAGCPVLQIILDQWSKDQHELKALKLEVAALRRKLQK